METEEPQISRRNSNAKDKNSNKEENKTVVVTKRVDALRRSLSELPETDRNEVLLELINKVIPSQGDVWSFIKKVEQHLKLDPVEVLPIEIVVHIFGFLTKKELFTASKVSKNWRAITRDPYLMKKKECGWIYCITCGSALGQETDILSKRIRLESSLAYKLKNVYNVEACRNQSSEEEEEEEETKSAKICCKKCQTEVGLKYFAIVTHTLSPSQGDDKIVDFSEEFSAEKPEKESPTTPRYLLKRRCLYLPGEPDAVIQLCCSACKVPLTKETDRLSWNYQLRGSQAYHFSSMKNVFLGKISQVDYMTGRYSVCDVSCSGCKIALGIKYVDAPNSQNAYKIGTYLIEKPKLRVFDPGQRQSHGEPHRSQMGRRGEGEANEGDFVLRSRRSTLWETLTGIFGKLLRD